MTPNEGTLSPLTSHCLCLFLTQLSPVFQMAHLVRSHPTLS